MQGLRHHEDRASVVNHPSVQFTVMKLNAIFSMHSRRDVVHGTVRSTWSLAVLLLFTVRPCDSAMRRRCVVEDGIEHCLIKCDRTRACPTWMYCDRSTNVATCVPCTICPDDDDVTRSRDRKLCADEPVRCRSTMRSSLSDLLCPQLRSLNVSACRGQCYSGSIRHLSPLGTRCVIACDYGNGRPTQTYNGTCVWQDGVIGRRVNATWKPDHLPDGITKENVHRTTTATTGADHTTTEWPSDTAAVWTLPVVVLVVCSVLVTCCVLFCLVAVRRLVRQTPPKNRRRDVDIDDGANAENTSSSSSPDTHANSSDDSRRCLKKATENSDDEDQTSGIVTQASSSFNTREPRENTREPREFSDQFSREFSREFSDQLSISLRSDDRAPPVDDCRHGTRRHDDPAADHREVLLCAADSSLRLLAGVDVMGRYDDVSVCPDETRCKLMF